MALHVHDSLHAEADWNLTADVAVTPYFYAKREAERAAYQVCAAQQQAQQADGGAETAGSGRPAWRLVSILPPAVWGPPLSDRQESESVNQMKMVMEGGWQLCGYIPLSALLRSYCWGVPRTGLASGQLL